MTADEIAGHWKLNVTVLPNGRCKEIISNTTRQDAPLDERVVIWNRHRDLAERVFLEKSSKGELRAIKRVALREDGNHPELDIIDKITKAAG